MRVGKPQVSRRRPGRCEDVHGRKLAACALGTVPTVRAVARVTTVDVLLIIISTIDITSSNDVTFAMGTYIWLISSQARIKPFDLFDLVDLVDLVDRGDSSLLRILKSDGSLSNS